MARDKLKQRALQLKYIQSRREKWIADHGGKCSYCRSTTSLEIDHIDPKSKKRRGDHRVWSWKKEKMEAELRKCQILCKRCHAKKTKHENSMVRGQYQSNAKLKNSEAEKIRKLYSSGDYTVFALGKMFGVHKSNISRIIRYVSYS